MIVAGKKLLKLSDGSSFEFLNPEESRIIYIGKWSYLKSKYPKLPIDADYQKKIDFVLQQAAPDCVLGPGEKEKGFKIENLSDQQLVTLYNNARDQVDKLAELTKVLNLEIEAYTRLFVNRWDEEGVVKKAFEGGITLSISDEPYPTVKDKDALTKWVKETGQEDLLTLNFQTMKSMVKSSLSEGKALPDGVDVFMKVGITRRGAGSKGETE